MTKHTGTGTPGRYQLSAQAQAYLDGLNSDPGQGHNFTGTQLPDHTPPDTFNGRAWYVVVCRPKSERMVQLGLRRKGYATYLPMMKRDVKHARTIETVERALLPRYLFLGIKPRQGFYGMRNVDGAEMIVRNNMVPVQVSDKGLKRLRDREAAGEFDYSGEEKRRRTERVAQCKPGSLIEITSGPMMGLHVVVEHVQATGQIRALIDFLGRSTPIRLGIQEVGLVEASP